MKSKRARRRTDELRMKSRARRVLRLWAAGCKFVTPRAVGINASTHCRPCSCFLCQPDRVVRSRYQAGADDTLES